MLVIYWSTTFHKQLWTRDFTSESSLTANLPASDGKQAALWKEASQSWNIQVKKQEMRFWGMTSLYPSLISDQESLLYEKIKSFWSSEKNVEEEVTVNSEDG